MTAPDCDLAGLFEGYGGLTLAAQAVLGGDLGWYSEIEPAACKVLAHHHPSVPNLGDITAVDWNTVPRPRVLTGGFPCQDVSSAGRRLGLRPDTRSGLWQHMAYAIDQLRPELVLIENVRGLLSADAHCDVEPSPWGVGDRPDRPLRALGAVLGDLADLGYDARWGGLRAADVGAPHGRYRIFITAWPAADTGRERHGRRQDGRVVGGLDRPDEVEERERERSRQLAGDRSDATHADPARVGRGEGRPEPARLSGRLDAPLGRDGSPADADGVGSVWGGAARGRRPGPADHDLPAPDTDGVRLERAESERLRLGQQPRDRHDRDHAVTWGQYGPAIRRWELILGRPAPAPTQTGARGGQQLSPRFVEWMQGLPDGWVCDVPDITRNEQLKMLGNGVVWQQAAAALEWLLATAGEVAA